MNNIASDVLDVARNAGLTLGTAESCTGGLVAGALTDIPGSSDVFVGGIVSYSNDIKEQLLSVDHHILETKGAVSQETARAMAVGSSKILNADLTVSTTGVAGPGGGSAEKPVGTVWFGVAYKGNPIKEELVRFDYNDREFIRKNAVEHALFLLLRVCTDSAKYAD